MKKSAYIFSGLPGVGKTTLAKQLSQAMPDTIYYRIDTIEYYLKKVYYQAKENIEFGKNIIIDCCNSILEFRKLWNLLSQIKNTKGISIEVICSDKQIHQNKIETGHKSNPNKYPT